MEGVNLEELDIQKDFCGPDKKNFNIKKYGKVGDYLIIQYVEWVFGLNRIAYGGYYFKNPLVGWVKSDYRFYNYEDCLLALMSEKHTEKIDTGIFAGKLYDFDRTVKTL